MLVIRKFGAISGMNSSMTIETRDNDVALDHATSNTRHHHHLAQNCYVTDLILESKK